MRTIVLVAAATLSAGCTGLGHYQQSTARFGEAATAGATAVRGALGGARETCRMRAWLHAVSDRFERPGAERGADPLAASAGVPRAGGGAPLTWGEYCGELAAQDEAVTAALTALEAYATALRDLAAQPTALDASLVAALAADVDGMAARMGGSPSATQALTAPAAGLARVVLDAVRTRRLREAVRAGEAPLAALLDGLDRYLDAADLQLQDARGLARAVVREADAAMPVRAEGERIPPELPGQALALHEFSRLELARLESAQGQLEASRALVGGLRAAHAALARGARAGADDAETGRAVAARLGEVVRQVLVLRRLEWRAL